MIKLFVTPMTTALITGASSGIGAAFARELARRQTDLILVARSQDKLTALATELRSQHSIAIEVIVQDLTEPRSGMAVYERVTQKGLAVDLLINNAGFADYGPFSDRPLQRQLDAIDLNVRALVELTHLFLPAMRDRRSGSIINLSSIGGFQPIPYMSVYAASKAFVLSFSEALWAENREFGIRVQALCPGPTETNFFHVAGFPESMNVNNTVTLISPERVVSDSLKALEKNQSVTIAGTLKAKAIVNLPRFFPREFLVSLMEKLFKSS